jgi:hypothetical protein
MNCPKCDAGTHVLETRQSRRRRQCLSCGYRFSTIETLLDAPPVAAPVAVAEPKPEPAAPRVTKAKAKAQAKLKARREVESRSWYNDDYYSPDNDYLPEV